MTGTLNSLSDKALTDLPATVGKPAYNRADLKTGIIHLGIGAFHRAHQAVYTENILQDDPSWGITGVSLRSSDTRDALAPQDYLYSVAVRDGAGEKLHVIGCLTDILVAPENPEAVLQAMCQPDIRIVTLTVTEKGYCYAPASRTLDESNSDIIHDLKHPHAPRSAPGFLVEAIRRRHASGLQPFTVLSCDNLPANGETLKRVTVRLAELTNPELGRFITEHVAFPSSMIDRIVPATTDQDRASVSRALNVKDQWPVCTEPFSQWVIEDHFPSGRPLWEKAGASFVRDVAAFELMKLRLLNGSHSTLAYLGFLSGHETVSATMAAAGFKTFIRAMMDEEITPTLPALPDFDLSTYKDQLIERFCNPALHHRTAQIAMDGSQKLPQRLLNTIQNRLLVGQSFDRLALGVAAWMRFVTGKDEHGQAIDIRDPLRDQLLQATAGLTTAQDILNALLAFDSIFAPELTQNARFKAVTLQQLETLLTNGAAKTVQDFKSVSTKA